MIMAEKLHIQSPNDGVSKKALAATLAAALLGWMFDGFEMGLFPLVARPALLELMGPEASKNIGTWIAIIISGFLLGAAAGGIMFGWLGDRIGRVKAMVLAVATYAIFSGLCAFVQAPWQLAALRLLASLGMGGEWSLGVALVMETWPAGKRVLLAGLIGAAANVGFLMIAVMGLVLANVIDSLGGVLIKAGLPQAWTDALLANSGWRMLLLLGALPAILAFLIQVFVPESKKWQHAAATTPKNRVIDIFKGGVGKPALLGAVISSVALLGMWGSTQWIPSWADKLGSDLVKAADTVQSAATGSTAPDTDRAALVLTAKTAKSWAQIWIAVGSILGSLVGAYMAQWTSRRWAYFILCVSSLGSCAYLFRMPMHYGGEFLFLAFLVGATTASFFGWLPLYLPELFPTRIRATAQGFAFNCGRILAAAGTLYAGSLLNYFNEDYAKMCAIITLVYALGLVLIWLCPETKGRPLPE